MIPVSLEIANFLSYRQPAMLDFNGIHTACISGANGAGKSTILEAITWSLFGKSRVRSDDDLINRLAVRDGEAAEVRYTFSLEEIIYRVVRSKRHGKATTLELQMQIGADAWRSMSGSGVRETSAHIESLLHLNYDTFINASFLLQGKADEFTTKTPNRRKQILSELIGASRWDQYQAAAITSRRQAEGELALLDGRLADVNQELGEADSRAAVLAEAQAAHAQLKERLVDKEQLLQQARRQVELVRHQRDMVRSLSQNAHRVRLSVDNLKRLRQERQQERHALTALLDKTDVITARHVHWRQLADKLQLYQQQERAYRDVQAQQRPHQVLIAQMQSRLQQRQESLRQHAERVAAMRPERDQVAQQQVELKAERESVRQRLAEMTRSEQAWQEARAALQELDSQRQLQQQRLKQLLREADKAAAARHEQATALQHQQEAVAAYETAQQQLADLGQKNTELMQMRADLDTARSEQPRLKGEMDKLIERIVRLKEEAEGQCPLCGQPLTESHRRQVLDELETEGKAKGDRYRANQTRIEQLQQQVLEIEPQVRQSPRLERALQAHQQRQATVQAQLDDAERRVAAWEAEGAAELAQLQAAIDEDDAWRAQQALVAGLADVVRGKPALEQQLTAVQERLARAEARLVEIDRALVDWSERGEMELAEVTDQLAADSYAPEARAALAALKVKEAGIGYDVSEHRQVEAAQVEVSDAPDRYQQLKQAEAAVKPLDDSLGDLAAQIADQATHQSELEQQLAEEETRLQELQAEQLDLAQVEKDVFELREREIAASQQVGAARQQVDVLADLQLRRDQFGNQRAELTRRISYLKLLEKACGRDGVQALLIEHAIPEIEQYANDLLAQLSHGQMQIFFNTQRQLKTRDELTETLEIQIADAAGERPYENYSGGEQFRVNFAIRLALSKLLARRAGARLQTLVIDEGFGSQDPQGRQRLVEAIHAVQDDFACLLVITHVDELRDAFDTRIEVGKGPAGSTLVVS